MNKIKRIFSAALISVAAISQAQVVPAVGPGGRPLTFPSKGVLVGQGTANVTGTGSGIAGQCLLSGGPSSDPAFGSCAAGASVSSVFGQAGAVPNLSGDVTTSGSSVTTLANSGVTAGTYGATTVDAKGRVTVGTVITPVANGGTGRSNSTANGVMIGAAGSPLNVTAVGANGQYLMSIGGGGAPTFTSLTSGSAILAGDGAGNIANVTIGSGLSYSAGTLSNTTPSAPVVQGHIYGFTLANNTTTPNTVLDISAGFAANNSGASYITGTAFSKSISSTWAAGSGNGGMGTGLTATANTWYHVFAIVRSGSYDVYFDTSLVAANAPASTTAARYAGSILLNASANIVAFKQLGQTFYWGTQFSDLSVGTGVITSPTLTALTVPVGISSMPIIICSSSAATVWPGINSSTAPLQPNCSAQGGNVSWLATNTARQIYVTSSGQAITIYTAGYLNPYVAPNI